MRTALLVALLSLAADLAAQRLALAINDDDSHNPGSAIGWPSGTVAMKFVPAANLQAAAAEIFTGNGTGTNRLAIWGHDAANDRPSAPLALPASWSMVAARCWQGAAFAAPVPLAGGTTFWLVWDVVNFAQNSVAATTVTPNVDVRVSADGGASWHAAVVWAAKLRIHEPHPTGTVLTYGAAKPGVHGDPRIDISGWPSVGNAFDVWVDDTARNVPALLLIGLPANVPLPFATVLVDPGPVLFFTTRFGTTPSFRGTATHTFRVPNLPAAAGFPLSFQWGVFDPAAADGLSHTAAVTALLQ